MGGGAFFDIPHGVQYVSVRTPPGPRSAGFNPAAALGRYDQGCSQCQTTAEGKALFLRVGLLRSIKGHAHSADPVPPNYTCPLKVAISLQRGAIFQHKAVLSYLIFTYSCHVLPSCLQVASKMPQDRNLTALKVPKP